MKKRSNKIIKLIHWLDTGIFPVNIMFSMNFTYDEIIKELKNKKANDWKLGISSEKDKELINGGWVAMRRDIENTRTNKIITNFYISLNTQFDFSDYDYCRLAHECLHITQFMLKDFLDRDREFECEAYLHTHIMQQCLKSIRGI